MIADGLAGVGKKYGVAVVLLGLQSFDGEVLLRDRVGMFLFVRQF